MNIDILYTDAIYFFGQEKQKSMKNLTAKYCSKDYFCFLAIEKLQNIYDVNKIDIIENQISITARIK
jgi:hypothetical protein